MSTACVSFSSSQKEGANERAPGAETKNKAQQRAAWSGCFLTGTFSAGYEVICDVSTHERIHMRDAIPTELVEQYTKNPLRLSKLETGNSKEVVVDNGDELSWRHCRCFCPFRQRR